MPEEPTTGELARSLRDIKESLDKVITQREWIAYQQGLEQRFSNITNQQVADAIRHSADVDRLQHQLEEHARQSATDKKALETRQASQRFAMLVLGVTLLGTFVLQFVQIGGGA